MAIQPYISFEAFKTANPVLNHSSRVYLIEPLTIIIYDLSVSDAVLLDADTPIIGLSTSTLTFPTVVLGEESDTLLLTISNTGTAPLTITGISASGDFSVESMT